MPTRQEHVQIMLEQYVIEAATVEWAFPIYNPNLLRVSAKNPNLHVMVLNVLYKYEGLSFKLIELSQRPVEQGKAFASCNKYGRERLWDQDVSS